MPASASLSTRFFSHVWLKALGTPAFMALFFIAYFALLRNPLSTPVEIPATALDRWIGFHPFALLPYASLWIYVSLPAALILRRAELFGHAAGAAALAAAGLLIFAVWPTVAPSPDIDWSLHPGVRFLKNLDASGNACPSLHAAFAVFACLWLDRLLRALNAGRAARALNLLWAVSILYSTIATRQHVAIDAAAGVLLGGLVAFINLRLCPGETTPCPTPR